jgi:hypothetical protein
MSGYSRCGKDETRSPATHPEVTLTIVEILRFWPARILARERQLQPEPQKQIDENFISPIAPF